MYKYLQLLGKLWSQLLWLLVLVFVLLVLFLHPIQPQLPAPNSHWFWYFRLIFYQLLLYLVVCITLCSFSVMYDTYEEYVLYVCTMYCSNIFSLLQGIVICFYGLLHSPIPGSSLCAATKEVNRAWFPLLFPFGGIRDTLTGRKPILHLPYSFSTAMDLHLLVMGLFSTRCQYHIRSETPSLRAIRCYSGWSKCLIYGQLVSL